LETCESLVKEGDMGAEAARYLRIFKEEMGPRHVGSPEWVRAREYIKKVLSGLGFGFEVIGFRLHLFIPVESSIQVSEKGSRSIGSLGAIGSPPAAAVEGLVKFVQYGREQEYVQGEDYTGTIVLAHLGKIPASEKAAIAARKGATALLLFPWDSAALPTVVLGQGKAPLPTLAIRRGDALPLTKGGTKAIVTIHSAEEEAFCENLIVEVGEGDDVLLFTAHYDTMPLRLGPTGSSMGTAVLLALLMRVRNKAHGRLRFVFFDAEELAAAGSRAYFDCLAANGSLGELAAVLDLNDLGTRRTLDLAVLDRKNETAMRLAILAQEAFEHVNLSVPIKVLKPDHLWRSLSYPQSLPVVWVRGRPNFLREAAGRMNPFLLSRLVAAFEMVIKTDLAVGEKQASI